MAYANGPKLRVVLAFTGLGVFFSPLPAGADNVELTQKNIITPVKSRPVGSRVAVGGTVTPLKSVTLAAQLPGRIVKIAGEEGDRFRAGTVLLNLDDADLLAKRRAAEAAWASADATLRNANVQYSRQVVSPGASRGTPGGMGMPGMFDEVFTNPMSGIMGTRDTGYERHADIYSQGVQIEQARHSMAQAVSEIHQIDTKLRDAKSVAPFDGVVVKKLVEVGDPVQPGQPLLEFADTSELQIVADVPARLTRNLMPGDELPARLDTSDELINVRVATVFPMADTLRHTIRVKFNISSEVKASPGIYAEVQIQDPLSSDTSLPVVPASSILWRGGLPMVFVVNHDQRTALRMVRVGETLPSGEVVVLSGLSSADQVLDKPAPGMASGYKLQ